MADEQAIEVAEAPIEDIDSEEHEPVDLDPEVAARREAALRHIVQYGDPVLKSRAIEIERFDENLIAEAHAMGALMDDAMGIGLAATQVGTMHRVLVYRVEHDSPINTLVNPEVVWSSKESDVFEEGCLSLRGVLVDVERPLHVRVKARNEYGDEQLIEASGLESRVIQHEIDHLDGVLILDRTSRDQRKEAMRILREAADR